MKFSATHAPGEPGYPLPWGASRKSGIGVAPGSSSRVWFTIARGIITEVFYPRIDLPCIRDFQFVVADGADFFSEERRDTRSRVTWMDTGVPGYEIRNQCAQGRYTLEKEALASPDQHALLLRCQFTPLQTRSQDLDLYAILSPRQVNPQAGVDATISHVKGEWIPTAEQESLAVAMACSAPYQELSVGYIGISDGWTDLARNKRLTARYQQAMNGHVGLVGKVDWQSTSGEFTMAIGFGNTSSEAAHRARASLQEGFTPARRRYVEGWRDWQDGLLHPPVKGSSAHNRVFRASAATLAAHQARDFPGGVIASLSCPWGNFHSDDELGGYHLVWPRDLYHATAGLIAMGASDEARAALAYFRATQEKDGHWPQNMWLDGDAYGAARQLDETAAPILAANLAFERDLLSEEEMRRYWPMIKAAARYITLEGPTTPQDRWEEIDGFSLHSLAISIAALLVAADIADDAGERELATRWREVADEWNDSIEDWCYVQGTNLADDASVEGHYIRVRPADIDGSPLPAGTQIMINNRPERDSLFKACDVVSADALSLVRYGLRKAHDRRILNTLKVIDHTLKVETPSGPVWRRYLYDGYGEKRNGDPFDGTGIGRPWPLITGERAHYELAAGNRSEARRLLGTLERLAARSGFLSEQVWDAHDLPARDLRFGRATGSARPLVWAHAEHICLLRSLADNQVFDCPKACKGRYAVAYTR